MDIYSDIVEGDIIFRTYLTSTIDNGFPFNSGDKAIWKKKGQWGMNLHSHNDLPALERSGNLQWFKDGREIRENGPQSIFVSGISIYDNGITRRVQYSNKYIETHKCHNGNPVKNKFFTYSMLPPCCQIAYTDKVDLSRVIVADYNA